MTPLPEPLFSSTPSRALGCFPPRRVFFFSRRPSIPPPSSILPPRRLSSRRPLSNTLRATRQAGVATGLLVTFVVGGRVTRAWENTGPVPGPGPDPDRYDDQVVPRRRRREAAWDRWKIDHYRWQSWSPATSRSRSRSARNWRSRAGCHLVICNLWTTEEGREIVTPKPGDPSSLDSFGDRRDCADSCREPSRGGFEDSCTHLAWNGFHPGERRIRCLVASVKDRVSSSSYRGFEQLAPRRTLMRCRPRYSS